MSKFPIALQLYSVRDDMEKDFWAFRDTTLTATLDWAVCDYLTVSPYISYSDHFAGPVRKAAKCDEHGMVMAFTGVRLFHH